MMKKITIGIIAHVDSGKTTLSEALLYLAGTIRKFGRVDKGASFLDNDQLERRRGITIYSKQARFSYGDTEFVLIDTPGHADFSAEMERTLEVLDYAVLIISAADSVTGRTRQLWRLLSHYQLPTVVFFNKMDQPGADKSRLLNAFRAGISREALDFDGPFDDAFYDEAAMCSEEAMEQYLQTGLISEDIIRSLIKERKMFPCIFGSALKMDGVERLLKVLDEYTREPEYPEAFGARVYKILRDSDGSRLTMVKITGGTFANKSLLPDNVKASADEQDTATSESGNTSKINQIRLYSGSRFELTDEVKAGDICALVGLKESFAGQGFGFESGNIPALMVPILSYRVILQDNEDPVRVFPFFRMLEEENPELKAVWDEENREISVSVMGKVQVEVLSEVLKTRFGLEVSFDSGQVMYRETIARPVIGAGHFEPLRHYAEVVLLMQPLKRGTGLIFESAVRSERLAQNWQRLILTHLRERSHKGVLTRSPITDMKITLIAGKAHLKHTEGGDFRQAVYRAVRQGLMMAESVLLEPYYRFILEIPTQYLGRAMTDLDMLGAVFGTPETGSDADTSVISGRAPVASIRDYPAQITAYSKGTGHVSFFNDGFDVCHNAREVIEKRAYDPLSDVRNTPDSVYCSHGSGYIVPYDEVYSHLDVSPEYFLESLEKPADEAEDETGDPFKDLNKAMDEARRAGLKTDSSEDAHRDLSELSIGTEEIDEIIARVARSNSKDKKSGNNWKRNFGNKDGSTAAGNAVIPEKTISNIPVFAIEEADYVVVDGYNVIFAWPELSDLARVNVDSARDALIDELSNFQAMTKGSVLAVFDAYRVKGHATEHMKLQDVEIVFTGEEETADQYIEKFTNVYGKKKKIAVVTSDGLEQLITRGQGCMLISSRDFRKHIDSLSAGLREKYGVKES